MGEVLERSDEEVVREFSPIQGTLRKGTLVRIDVSAFPGDPLQAFGLPFEEVKFASQLGEFPAWFVDGSGSTWAIFVHGKGAERREALRILPTVAAIGLPCLVITYRSDPEAPASPDGLYRYGRTEWQDLEAAARYALEQGADRLVLLGYSMGGAIVVNFLYESPLAARVVGVILDAPMLDLEATIESAAERSGAPGLLVSVGKAIAGVRYDVEWGKLNYLERADELAAPVLLVHGDADRTVPIETSEALAEARPDIVTFVRVAGAGHVRAWNTDRDTYQRSVREFLERVVRP